MPENETKLEQFIGESQLPVLLVGKIHGDTETSGNDAGDASL